jgi:hypothetical protein
LLAAAAAALLQLGALELLVARAEEELLAEAVLLRTMERLVAQLALVIQRLAVLQLSVTLVFWGVVVVPLALELDTWVALVLLLVAAGAERMLLHSPEEPEEQVRNTLAVLAELVFLMLAAAVAVALVR